MTVSVWFVFTVAPESIDTCAVIVSSSTTFWVPMVSGAAALTTPFVRWRPRSVASTVSPGDPAPGSMPVIVGPGPAGTTKNSGVVCPLSVVTMRSRASVVLGVAPAPIVSVAVSVQSSGVATSVMVTSCVPPGVVMTRAAPVRCAPVMVSGTVALVTATC